MTRISVQDLKAQLSSAIAQAESGDTLVITRHNQPVARLVPAVPPHVHRGARVGAGRLRPAIQGGLRGEKGRYLAVLMDDRGNR
jgi:prevent-host-death family protein